MIEALESRLKSAGLNEEQAEEAMVYNLPLGAADAELVKAEGPILSGEGLKIIPPRTLFDTPRDFSYNAFTEPLVIERERMDRWLSSV